MVPPAGDGSSPAPIDRPVLEFLRDRLETTPQVERAVITDADGHLELRVELSTAYYPDNVRATTLSVRWYANDDFKIHYREACDGSDWECRWDRHPNPHNAREHFHEPPDASTPGKDASWPDDYREVLTLVLDDVAKRIANLWSE
jgi:hypothetical protein